MNAERGTDTWQPLPKISYGFALHPFSPSTYATQLASSQHARHASATSASSEAAQAQADPFMVDLEVGDEVYAFEKYVPRLGGERNMWFRGYVVSTSRTPFAASGTADPAGAAALGSTSGKAPEPSVFLGIFPAAFVHVREELDDAEGRLGATWREFEESRRLDEGRFGSGAGKGKARMEALPEDEEEEDEGEPAAGSPTARDGTAAAPNASGAGRGAASSTREKLPPPIPSLKAGDETLGGAREPLVDEVACALREWYLRLFAYLLRREYGLFRLVQEHIAALHLARKQLIDQTLGSEELAAVRRDCVARLVKGNVGQGLDVIVRHPTWGGLVTVAEGDTDPSTVDPKSFVSGIRMYSMQVASAYINSPLHPAANRSALPPLQTPVAAVQKPKPYHRPTGSQSTLSLKRFGPAKKALLPAASEGAPLGGDFHHLFLEVRAFVANPCAAGETAELAFSLYSMTTGQFITEDFLVVMNHQGAPATDALRRVRTLFKDLGAQELGGIALVCKIVRVGSLKMAAVGSTPAASPPASVRSSFAGPDSPDPARTAANGQAPHGGKGLMAPFRRPFGCAVVDVTKLMNAPETDGSPTQPKSVSLQVYVPNDEAGFASLHEDIIQGRSEFFSRSPRANSVAVDVKSFFGRPQTIAKAHAALLEDCTSTEPLGFPDVVFPGQDRNDLYIKLWAADFSSTAGGGGGGAARVRKGAFGVGPQAASGVFQVTVEVRRQQGVVGVDRAISRGAHEPPAAEFHSLVFAKTAAPTFGELIKVSNLEPAVMKDCHLFITYRQRNPLRERPAGGGEPAGLERPFAFSYLPLHPTETGVFLPDGNHELVVYRADKLNTITPAQYFGVPSVLPAGTTVDDLQIPADLGRLLTPVRDSLSVRSFLCSTLFTQSEVLVRLLAWETNGLFQDQSALTAVLKSFAFVSEVEVCKVLKDVFDALFSLLVANSTDNPNVGVEALVFDSLVTVLGIVQDRRFQNFKPVLDVYIDHHFSFASVWRQLIRSMSRLLADKTSPQLRAAIKVWHYIFRFISRSRELQKQKDSYLGGTSERLTEHLESAFKSGLDLLLRDFIDLMRMSQPSSIIGTQTIALQHFSDILPDLAQTFDAAELSEIIVLFSDAAPQGTGKTIVWKLLLHLQTARSVVFDDASARASLVPSLVRWIKPFLGRRPPDIIAASAADEAAQDAARIAWVETLRLAVTVLAVILDKLSEFVVLAARQSRTATLQERENIDLVFSCLPKLLDSYHELRSRPTLEAIDRHQAVSSVVHAVPVVFPATSPSPLISPPPASSSDKDGPVTALNNTLGEVAAVILVMLLVQPTDGIKAFLDEQLEVEGAANLNRTVLSLFQASSSILRFEAFPQHWLNVTLLSHTVILKVLRLLAPTMVAINIPDRSSTAPLDVPLWNACFETQFLLLSSDQVVIESFSPQKRRAVWRLAGDIRGDGAATLKYLWQALGEPRPTAGGTPYGRHQSQFLGYVQNVLTLCLSHHDHLRTEAVDILCTMILSEWALHGSFTEVKSEIIDKLDFIFMTGGEGDDLARVYFVTSLRGMFDEPSIDPRLRQAVDDFLDSVDRFLDLLLNLRDLPTGDEYQDDRTVCTLRLLNFIRRIGGRDAMYIQYVHQLVDAHVRAGDYTEAGLTLKMHAALYDWKSGAFIEPFAYGDLALPRQSQFARKEALLLQTLDYLGRGKAFELAIETCKELEYQHANVTFDYLRLAELLSHHSRLSESIILEPRPVPHYFLVSYFGPFPLAVRNRQFVYRGADWEKLTGFLDRLQNKHPSARLIKADFVPDDVRSGQDLCIQVLPVVAEPDRSKSVLRPDVPREVRSYYEANNIKHFSHSRPFSKSGVTDGDVSVADVYIERTYFTTEETLPALIRRSEIVATRTVEISGLENAIHDVQTKTKELDTLESKFTLLAASDEDVDTNPLSMALNGAVDSPHKGGVPAYRKAFFSPAFLEANPTESDLVEELRISIDLHVLAIHRCLTVHAALCPVSMFPFHMTIQQFFTKNFGDETERLHLSEPELYRPSPARPSSPSLVEDPRRPSHGGSSSRYPADDFGPPLSVRESADVRRQPSTTASSTGAGEPSYVYSPSVNGTAGGGGSASAAPAGRDGRALGSHDAQSISQFSTYSFGVSTTGGPAPNGARASTTPLPQHYAPVGRAERAGSAPTKQRSESRLSRTLGSVLRKKSTA